MSFKSARAGISPSATASPPHNGSTSLRARCGIQRRIKCGTSQRFPPAHLSGGLGVLTELHNSSAATIVLHSLYRRNPRGSRWCPQYPTFLRDRKAQRLLRRPLRSKDARNTMPHAGLGAMDAQRAGSPLPSLEAFPAGGQPMNEMFDAQGHPRPECVRVASYLLAMESKRLAELGERAHRMFQTMGVTFNVYGNEDGEERIFPFDPVPRIIPAQTWAEIEAGLVQRSRALNAFVADVYNKGCILKDEAIPRDLVLGCQQFRHAAAGIKSPCGVYITVAGIDLVRGADGRFYVLEDNVRTPSGVSYVLENRRIMTRLLPELIRALHVRSVENYPADLLASLQELSPRGVSNPTIALLTPGPFNSAFFEHVFLSQQMGVELVEGRDLICVDHKLFMKAVHGFRLHARNDSLLSGRGTGSADCRYLSVARAGCERDGVARSRPLCDQTHRSVGRLRSCDRAQGYRRGIGDNAAAHRAGPGRIHRPARHPAFRASHTGEQRQRRIIDPAAC